jgi:SAM-dependent methyltransferase
MIFRFLSAVSSKNLPRLSALDRRLRDFYGSATDQGYWTCAEEQNTDWRDGRHPHHERLLQVIGPDDRVGDFGCGSAHAVAALGNPERYTGIDWSERQVAADAAKYPAARFFSSSLYATPLNDGDVDFAISLFVLEHCVFPTRLLDEMLRVVHDDGRIAIICPQMRPRIMNSMWSGLSAVQSFWEKTRRRRYADALWHMIELRLLFPIFCKLADRRSRKFLIYPEPRCFYAPYSADTDAVYWADEGEVREYLASRGCEIESSPSPPGSDSVFVIARKRSR